MSTVTKKLMLYFPECETEKPIVYHLVKDYDLVVNIFRAIVTPEEEGFLVLDVTGNPGASESGNRVSQISGDQGGYDPERAHLEGGKLRPVRQLHSSLSYGSPLHSRSKVHGSGLRFRKVRGVSELYQGLSLRGCTLPVLIRGDMQAVSYVHSPEFREFHYKGAHLRILSSCWEEVTDTILAVRENLEAFIRLHPSFESALSPLDLGEESHFPEAVKRMMDASRRTGLGPMAAVAGTVAQLAAEAGRKAGSAQTIVENGGDVYLDGSEEVVLGLYTGKNSHFKDLALRILPEGLPLAVCSSSSRMGHSLSFGDCDLVTVFSWDASLADAAATLGGNLVRTEKDIEPALSRLTAIEGVRGALIIRDDRFGVVGEIPELIRSRDVHLDQKISRDDASDFSL